MNEIKTKLEKIFNDILNVQNFDLNISMENTPDWDSLKHLQLLMEIEKTFNIEIQFEDSLKMSSAKNIIKIIQNKIKI